MARISDRVLAAPSEDFLPKFVASLDPEWIEEALAATGTATIRRRRLPAEQVVWLVIGMCIFRNLSMRELVATMDLALPGSRGIRVAPSSIVQARAARRRAATVAVRAHGRDLGACQREDARVARAGDLRSGRDHGARSRLDGEPRALGGQKTRWDSTSGYPLARMVTLMALRSHILAGAQFGPYATAEGPLAEALWRDLSSHEQAAASRHRESPRPDDTAEKVQTRIARDSNTAPIIPCYSG